MNITTADVEKIAREAAHELHLQAYILEPSDNGLVNILSKYFAQARAPLVEALRKIEDSHSQLFPMQLRAIAHNALQAAALTGTGEQK